MIQFSRVFLIVVLKVSKNGVRKTLVGVQPLTATSEERALNLKHAYEKANKAREIVFDIWEREVLVDQPKEETVCFASMFKPYFDFMEKHSPKREVLVS